MKLKLAVMVALLSMASVAFAVPSSFTVQGVLRNSAGQLQSMMVNVTVKMFDAQMNGTQIGATFGPQAVMSQDGLFTVVFNVSDVSAITAASSVWMEVTAGNDTFPRQLVTSEIFALVCRTAETLAASCSGCVTSAMIGSLDATKVTGAVSDSNKLGNVAAANYLQKTSKIVVAANSKTYSINAIYCGATAVITDVSTIGGYVGAKSKCETACSSASAHMCSAEEMIRSASLDIVMPYGWYSKLAISTSNDDCLGWTSNSGTDNGASWNPTAKAGNQNLCNNPGNTILCCD